MRMQAGRREQGSIYWRPESRSMGTLHTPVAGIYEHCSLNFTRFPQQNQCVNLIADGFQYRTVSD